MSAVAEAEWKLISRDSHLTVLWFGKKVAWLRSKGWSGCEYRTAYVVALPKSSKSSSPFYQQWENAKVGVAVKTRDGSWRPTYVEWRNLKDHQIPAT